MKLEAIGSNIEKQLRSVMASISKQAGERVDIDDYCESISYPKRFKRQKDMIKFFRESQDPRMLLGARGTGKTDTVSIIGVAEDLEANPEHTYIMVTKERDRGYEIVAEIREILERRGVKIKNRSRKVLRLKGNTGKDPSIIALSIRSRSFRGRHPYCVVLEDPITPEDDSQAERKRVWKTYEEILKLTQNVLIIGQPVHPKDLYARLRYQIPTLSVPWGEIPELDHDLNKLRASGVTEASISASYFLEILDDKSLPFAKIRVGNQYANKNIMFIDPSHRGVDFTAIVMAGRHLNDIAITGFCFNKAWQDCLDEIQFLYNHYSCQASCIETNGIGRIAVTELNRAGLGAEEILSTENKHKRILIASAYIDNIKLAKAEGINPEYIQANQIFIEQVQDYEYNIKNDDAPDALAGALKYLGVIEYV